jgi:hypothetical protein
MNPIRKLFIDGEHDSIVEEKDWSKAGIDDIKPIDNTYKYWHFLPMISVAYIIAVITENFTGMNWIIISFLVFVSLWLTRYTFVWRLLQPPADLKDPRSADIEYGISSWAWMIRLIIGFILIGLLISGVIFVVRLLLGLS